MSDTQATKGNTPQPAVRYVLGPMESLNRSDMEMMADLMGWPIDQIREVTE